MKPHFTDTKKYPVPYRAACDTDISKTFERIRRQQKLNETETMRKVESINRYIKVVAA